MATISGFWKFTATISAGDRSKTTSVCYKGPTVLTSAITQARLWVNIMADLLGNAGPVATPDTTPMPKSPYVTFLRITDAQNPRYGGLIENPTGNIQYCGLGGTDTGAAAADFISTALSMRMYGEDATSGAKAYANHRYGVPDNVVINGDQLFLDLLTGGSAYRLTVVSYLTFPSTPTTLWASWLKIRANRKKLLMPSSWRLSRSTLLRCWQLTVTGHGYTSKDRVSLTQVNNPFFRGRYKIVVVDANTIALVNGPPVSVVPVPTTGQVQLPTGQRHQG